MASSLTSASLRSGLLFIVFLGLISLGAVYLLFWKQPSAIDNLNQQTFRLNYAAFKNGIKLAHYRFIANQNLHQANELNDRWLKGETGLDYNKNGFPIGINISNSRIQTPQSSQDCVDIWQFVLGPLQPAIFISPSENNYWAELTAIDNCVYHAENVENMSVLYHFTHGNVELIELTD